MAYLSVLLSTYFYGNEIKEDVIGERCSRSWTWGKWECIQIWTGKSRERGYIWEAYEDDVI